jgi:hypothetical protein
MNEQSPICHECPVKNACPLGIRASKLANAILREEILDKDARSQLSTLKKIANTYNCPPEERKRLVNPLDQRINPNRIPAVITHSPDAIADTYERDHARAYYDNVRGMKGFRRGRRTMNGAS